MLFERDTSSERICPSLPETIDFKICYGSTQSMYRKRQVDVFTLQQGSAVEVTDPALVGHLLVLLEPLNSHVVQIWEVPYE